MNMFWVDLSIAVLISLVFSTFLVTVVRWRRPGTKRIWPSLYFLFILLFLIIWAGGIWLIPFGPKFLNIYWFPFIGSAVTFSLILITLIPPQKRVTPTIKFVSEKEKEKIESSKTDKVIGILFWLLILILLAIIIIRYTIIK